MATLFCKWLLEAYLAGLVVTYAVLALLDRGSPEAERYTPRELWWLSASWPFTLSAFVAIWRESE